MGRTARQRANGAPCAPTPDPIRKGTLVGSSRCTPRPAASISSRGTWAIPLGAPQEEFPSGEAGRRGGRQHVGPGGTWLRTRLLADRGGPGEPRGRTGTAPAELRGAPSRARGPARRQARSALCSAENYGRELGGPARGKKNPRPMRRPKRRASLADARPVPVPVPLPPSPLRAESPPPQPFRQSARSEQSLPLRFAAFRAGRGPGRAPPSEPGGPRSAGASPSPDARQEQPRPPGRPPPAPTCSSLLCAAARPGRAAPLFRAAQPSPWAGPPPSHRPRRLAGHPRHGAAAVRGEARRVLPRARSSAVPACPA